LATVAVFVLIYTNGLKAKFYRSYLNAHGTQQILREYCGLLHFAIRCCTIFGHMPVDELHSIENKEDVLVQIFLTPATGRVCSHSFFDVTEFFRLVLRTGAEAGSGKIGSQDRTFKGTATVFSKVLVEKNR
jgi:hypothetical protein